MAKFWRYDLWKQREDATANFRQYPGTHCPRKALLFSWKNVHDNLAFSIRCRCFSFLLKESVWIIKTEVPIESCSIKQVFRKKYSWMQQFYATIKVLRINCEGLHFSTAAGLLLVTLLKNELLLKISQSSQENVCAGVSGRFKNKKWKKDALNFFKQFSYERMN